MSILYIVSGCLAFMTLLLFDWALMRGFTRIKSSFLIIATLLLLIGVSGVVSTPSETTFSPWITYTGWVGLIFFGLLLIFSLFIEIPLITTYLGHGTNRLLVTTGTYALSRHPGVLWFIGLMLSFILIHPSRITLQAALSWLTADILLVWSEDRYLFPRIFPSYIAYQSTTPFLWPTRASLRRCLATLKFNSKSVQELKMHTLRDIPDSSDRGAQEHGPPEEETNVEGQRTLKTRS
ncbi:MAG: hypothetical protein GTO14_13325 [Anaerolineales bacterium]|nr:hypothetical protein [Anaerolineales bacterium]